MGKAMYIEISSEEEDEQSNNKFRCRLHNE